MKLHSRFPLVLLSVSALFGQAKYEYKTPPGVEHVAPPSNAKDPNTPPMHIPIKISACEARQCGEWDFQGTIYGTGQWPSGAVATLDVKKFDSEGVIIHRHDYTGATPDFDAVYTGKVFGNQIKGDVVWSWPGHWDHSPKGNWAGTIAPADYTILDPNLSCKPTWRMSSAEALERGAQAMDMKKPESSVCWLRIAAAQGNPTAQGFLAAILYKGIGVPVNLPEAVIFAVKAATEHDYVGERCLSMIYAHGDILPKDPVESERLRVEAEKDKAAAVEAEQRAEREFKAGQQAASNIQQEQRQLQAGDGQTRVRQNAQGLALLGLFLGAFAGGSSDNAWHSESASRESRRMSMAACGNAYSSPAACH